MAERLVGKQAPDFTLETALGNGVDFGTLHCPITKANGWYYSSTRLILHLYVLQKLHL